MWASITFDLYRDDHCVVRETMVLNDGNWSDPDTDGETMVWERGLRVFDNVH